MERVKRPQADLRPILKQKRPGSRRGFDVGYRGQIAEEQICPSVS